MNRWSFLAGSLPLLVACVDAGRARDEAIDPVRERAARLVGEELSLGVVVHVSF